MDREWLDAQLEAGRSFEEIGRAVGRHGSTIAYWARRYGLVSEHKERHASRGAPDRAQLEQLAANGATLAEIAEAIDRSPSTVRHWLKRWGIERVRETRRPKDVAAAPILAEMTCFRHGKTMFRLEGRGYYRCLRCRQEHVSKWRRRLKRKLVEEAGGRCVLCGYSRCQAALQFHHVDPSAKSFALSHEGVTRSLKRAREEAQKCVLLCANCHAEVEAGVTALPDSTSRGGRKAA